MSLFNRAVNNGNDVNSQSDNGDVFSNKLAFCSQAVPGHQYCRDDKTGKSQPAFVSYKVCSSI